METKLYYGISEVAKMLDVNPSLLRYWEKEFDCIQPKKNKKGTRSYTASDIELLRRIHYLTKTCGLTLEGARQQLRGQGGASRVAQVGNLGSEETLRMVDQLREIRDFLVALKESL